MIYLIPVLHELTHERFTIDNEGDVSVPDGSGLGVTINDATIHTYRVA